MKDISEIVNYLYYCLTNEESIIILKDSYLTLKIIISLPPSNFFDYMKQHPNEIKLGEYKSLTIATFTKDYNEIIISDKNEISFICNKKDVINDDMETIYEFFSCINCKKIVSEAYSCNCGKFICSKCFKDYYNKNSKDNKDCEFNKDEEVNTIVLKLFENGKIKKDKINFYILRQSNLKDLFLQKKLYKLFIPDMKSITPKGSLDLIDNLTSEEIINNFKILEEDLTPLNLLDLISTIGSLVNNYINDMQKTNPKHFIGISKALHSNKNSALFISGIMAKFLSDQGINVAIEEKSSSKTLSKNLLDWLMIGLLKFKKIVLHLDYGKTRNEEILTKEEEQIKLVQEWKDKIIQKVGNIDLYPISVKQGSLDISFATSSEADFSSLADLECFNEVQDIKYKMLLEGCLISLEMFDTQWNNSGSGWAGSGEKRGGAIYDPPKKYDGYGLKVSKQYDNNDDTWLGMKNIPGEWWVAYHGAGRNTDDEKIKAIIKSIVENGLIPGRNQVHQGYNNINNRSNMEYPTVGTGVYLTNKINVAEGYAGKVRDDERNEYKIVFMCRVCPEKARISEGDNDYFVLDPNSDCIRPYRILLRNNRQNSFCVIY